MLNISKKVVEEFLNEWAELHSGRQPIGWMLRRDEALAWVRFHALPQSKRYPQDRAELDVILARANEIGDALLGVGAPCWMIEAYADETAGKGEYAGRFVQDDDDAELDPVIWRYFVTPVEWRAGAFDGALAEIADDCPFHVVWMARSGGAIFAPYDGGFDLFPVELAQVERLKAKWPDWLSSHPAGL